MLGWFILFAVIVFAVILVVRAACFRPAPVEQCEAPKIEIDNAVLTERLARLISIPTVSNTDWSKVDETQFELFRSRLSEMYPRVHEKCPPERIGPTGILFHWKGKSAEKPVVLMAHYDVVPVEENLWQHPPFCAEVIEGELWGRGTLDTKITLFGVMEAVERLIGEGFVPANDIYMAFSGDEEISGISAPAIVDAFEQRGIVPAFVLDEGGAIVQKVFPGVSNPIAVVGIGEKGMAEIRLSVKGKGGHASQPPKHTALGVLARAICACENRPFKAELTFPVRELLKKAGAHAPFALRIVFANLWCFGGLLARMASLLGGDLNAMMRTTQSFNMAEGSKQSNVIPSVASAVANLRLLNTTTPEDARSHMEKAIGDPSVEVTVLRGQNASPYADPTCVEFGAMENAIRHTWGQDVIVSPYLMMACSDSRHYSRICKNVFKFSAMALSKEQRALIHNEDERIPVEKIGECVEFYTRLVRYL